MRDNVRAFVRLAAQCLELRGPVFEFGSYLVEGQGGRGDLRSLFPGRRYTGCDLRSGPGVDRIEDLAQLSLADGSAQTILCVDALEHVFEARRAVDEMVRVLAPGGALLVAVPMHFRIHDYPDDYWRFTPACIDRLLAGLPARLLGWQGEESYPHTVLAMAFKPPLAPDLGPRLARLTQGYQQWLPEHAKSLPWTRRAKRSLTGWFRGRGQRRAQREYHRVRFALEVPSGEWSAPQVLRELAESLSGGRIDLS